jgi:ABC-type nitrate/sulfonate/bicarbonate transport system substrate-binding protein
MAQLATIDAMIDMGYTIDNANLADAALVTEGIAQGRFQLASANVGSLVASEQGAPVKWIVDRVNNEWMVYAKKGIETCEEIVRSRLAIHSPGSVSGAMIRDWIGNNCPPAVAAEYDPLIIAGSENRYAALLADQIDASPVEFADALKLDAHGGFTRVVSFAHDSPELRPLSISGYEPWMKENPDVVRTFIRELLLQNRRINSEEGYLLELINRYLPDEENAEALAEAYVEAEIFPNDGGVTEAGVEYTLRFFGPNGTGDLKTEMSVSDVADLSYLEAVLEEIGRE